PSPSIGICGVWVQELARGCAIHDGRNEGCTARIPGGRERTHAALSILGMIEDVVELGTKFNAPRFRNPCPLQDIDVEVGGSRCAFRITSEIPNAWNTARGSRCICRKADEVGRIRVNRRIVGIGIDVSGYKATVSHRSGTNTSLTIWVDV